LPLSEVEGLIVKEQGFDFAQPDRPENVIDNDLLIWIKNSIMVKN
jgi:hypothetical protein